MACNKPEETIVGGSDDERKRKRARVPETFNESDMRDTCIPPPHMRERKQECMHCTLAFFLSYEEASEKRSKFDQLANSKQIW